VSEFLVDPTPLQTRKPADVTSDTKHLSEVDSARPHLVSGALALETARSLAAAYQAAADYAGSARAANTVRAYSSDWRDFQSWCASKNLPSMPAEPMTIGLYISHLAQLGRKASTIERRLSSISQEHKRLEHPSPCTAHSVRKVLQGIKRRHGVMQNAKAAAVTDDVRAMVTALPDDIHGTRDRALLLVGFAGAFRRGELAAVAIEDLEFSRDGVIVLLRRSKTDQEGAGRQVGIMYGQHPETCPVRALRAWIKASDIDRGPIFRKVDRWGHVGARGLCDKSVVLIVKRQAAAAGLDATRFAGHSLRAGFATAAANAGFDERKIMAQTGHKSVVMVRRYIRISEIFRGNPSGGVGL